MDVPATFINCMLESYSKANIPSRIAEFAEKKYGKVNKEGIKKLVTEVVSNLKTIDFKRPQQIYRESRAEEILMEANKKDSEVNNNSTSKFNAHDYFLYNLAKSLEEEIKQLEIEIAQMQQ
uniref:KfrA_N domain-containing protein n=1 Tax=Rhabditophanes sp. KR3021 TaxID=114890 RepID=A0AC35TWK9_9BILA